MKKLRLILIAFVMSSAFIVSSCTEENVSPLQNASTGNEGSVATQNDPPE